jgi:hypothetical protein
MPHVKFGVNGQESSQQSPAFHTAAVVVHIKNLGNETEPCQTRDNYRSFDKLQKSESYKSMNTYLNRKFRTA